jgi:hypothetical protein
MLLSEEPIRLCAAMPVANAMMSIMTYAFILHE